MKIYLAGPMRGLRGWNFDKFDEAERVWREAGHQPFSPAQTLRVLGYPINEALVNRGRLVHVMQVDTAALYASDAIGLLPGWEKSRGVAVEVALAQFLEMRIYDALTMQPIKVKPCPWMDANYQGNLIKEPTDGAENPQREHSLCPAGSDVPEPGTEPAADNEDHKPKRGRPRLYGTRAGDV